MDADRAAAFSVGNVQAEVLPAFKLWHDVWLHCVSTSHLRFVRRRGLRDVEASTRVGHQDTDRSGMPHRDANGQEPAAEHVP